jgi:inner membrane protein
METIENSLSLIDRFNTWLVESITVKLVSIGFLVLILLIPSAWIQSLIAERESRAATAMEEVASKWSGSQTVSGPVLVIPFVRYEKVDRGKDGIESIQHVEKAYFLPDELNVNAKVAPEVLHRGIFDAVVYRSTLDVNSTFSTPDLESLHINKEDVRWEDAFFALGISDLRGITENPDFTIGGSRLVPEPSNDSGLAIPKRADQADQKTATSATYSNFSTSGVVVKPKWKSAENFQGEVALKLSLKGSKSLDFIPSGKTTAVKLSGKWRNPSFDGEFLPASRTVTDDEFSASWNILHFNRPFAQQWIGTEQHISGSNFGVNLLIPVDEYQKSMRTAKYGFMVVMLTFIALFMVEIIRKIRIHPFQYILIGAALIIFYSLLISVAEHAGYNVSYLVSSAATILLITLYASTFLRELKLTLFFMMILSVFYSFIFIIIQEQDYSLLLGSVGLFVIIAMLMFFSRKINWYKKA